MTLQFQLRREDAVAFNLAFNFSSPTYKKSRARTRWMGVLAAAMFELGRSLESGFELSRTLFLGAIAVGWYLLSPKWFDAIIRKNVEKFVTETASAGMLGAYTLTLTDEGLHAVSPMGTSTFTWDAVTDVRLTPDYLHLFLGAIGYPIQIADIGHEAAGQAFAFVNQHRSQRAGA